MMNNQSSYHITGVDPAKPGTDRTVITSIYEFGDIKIDTVSRLAFWGDHQENRTHLSLGEMRMLIAFACEPERCFSVDDLQRAAELGSANTVYVYINRMRTKFEQRFIFGCHGGYYFRRKRP